MLPTQERIDVCVANREHIAQAMAQILANAAGLTEFELSHRLKGVYAEPFHDSGWYDPPPDGIGVLFAEARDDFARSKFPNLRTNQYWPNSNYRFGADSVAFAYVSPVDIKTGLIADLSVSVYTGDNHAIRAHLQVCVEATEAIAELAEVGMPFKELFLRAEDLLRQYGLHNNWMVTTNDPTHGADFGHTFPWSHEEPTSDEQRVIQDGDFDELKALISHKRLYLNPIEAFAIPENIVFSIEPRLGSLENKMLPAANFYTMVVFKNGQRRITSHFNPIFDALGITYMRSKYD